MFLPFEMSVPFATRLIKAVTREKGGAIPRYGRTALPLRDLAVREFGLQPN
jgi:hypothetical protein